MCSPNFGPPFLSSVTCWEVSSCRYLLVDVSIFFFPTVWHIQYSISPVIYLLPFRSLPVLCVGEITLTFNPLGSIPLLYGSLLYSTAYCSVFYPPGEPVSSILIPSILPACILQTILRSEYLRSLCHFNLAITLLRRISVWFCHKCKP